MKHFFTALIGFQALLVSAQGNSIHTYPWNPDSNNDQFVGLTDFTDFLSTYGSQYGNSPEPCDYDGTQLEEWCVSVANGEIVLDSVFIEYQLENTFSYFIPGCPEMVTDTIAFSNYAMTYSPGSFSSSNFPTTLLASSGDDAFGQNLTLALLFNQSNNRYIWYLSSYSILEQYGYDNVFGGWQVSTNIQGVELPWPDGDNAWSLDENGIQLAGWYGDAWPDYANYLHILPYWHYAE